VPAYVAFEMRDSGIGAHFLKDGADGSGTSSDTHGGREVLVKHDETFEGSILAIDEAWFIRCKSNSCTPHYSGGAFELSECEITNNPLFSREPQSARRRCCSTLGCSTGRSKAPLTRGCLLA